MACNFCPAIPGNTIVISTRSTCMTCASPINYLGQAEYLGHKSSAYGIVAAFYVAGLVCDGCGATITELLEICEAGPGLTIEYSSIDSLREQGY